MRNPPCLRMADNALFVGYPRYIYIYIHIWTSGYHCQYEYKAVYFSVFVSWIQGLNQSIVESSAVSTKIVVIMMPITTLYSVLSCVDYINCSAPGERHQGFYIKISVYQHRRSPCRDETNLHKRPSYFQSGIPLRAGFFILKRGPGWKKETNRIT